MEKAMQLAGGDNYIQAATDADKRMGTDTAPLNVYSERCGGTARRAQLKRKASEISRSACETFAYCTSRTTSIQDTAMLLSTYANVSYILNSSNLLRNVHNLYILHNMHNLHYMHKTHNNAVIGVLCTNNLLQDGFCPREVEFRSLQAMSKAMMDRMLPDAKVNVISLHEGTSPCLFFSVQFLKKLFAELDGDQDLELYWIDPVDAMDRLVARPEFQGKIYLQYERQESEQRPTKRAFGRANSGLVFQEAQALDLNSVPMLHLFYADKSFSGAHGTKYPVYGT